MKIIKKIILSSLIFSLPSFATNGDNLIGQGAVNRALGGLGIGLPVETDSVFKNPAWISDYRGTIFSFAATVFLPKVKARVDKMRFRVDGDNSGRFGDSGEDYYMPAMFTYGAIRSRADIFPIPEIALIEELSKHWTFGLGAFGVSGLGADYRNRSIMAGMSVLSHVNTLFQYMSIVPALSYDTGNLYIGAGLNIAYGNLSINAVTCDMNDDGSLRVNPDTGKPICSQAGAGPSSHIGLGYIFGMGYKLGFLRLGFNFQSQVAMKYNRVFDFDRDGRYDAEKLNQPSEIGAGIGFDFGSVRFGVDWKRINWALAPGYKDFGWNNQNVFAFGIEFNFSKVEFRFGYNHGESPIKEVNKIEKITYKNAEEIAKEINNSYMDLVGFPAIAEDTFAAGMELKLWRNFSLDFALTYVPEAVLTHKYGEYTEGDLMDVTAYNQQTAITVGFKVFY